MAEWTFKRDTAFRKQFFVPNSFAHPAKMDAQLLIKIVEEYTSPGETILDPMAGSGTLMLACTLGRNVVLVELEEKFCQMMRANWEKVRMRPMMGYEMGDCQIIQGDARELENILCDKIITSPPFGDAQFNYKHGLKDLGNKNFKGRKVWEECFEQQVSEDNIGNLPYRAIDKIVTSPPYGESEIASKVSHGSTPIKHRPVGYSKDPQNIGNLIYGEVSSIITSPPYSATDVSQTHMTSNKRGDPNNPNYRPSWKRKLAEGYAESKRPYHEVDSIITSPPYAEAQSGGGIAKYGYQGNKHSPTDLIGKRSYMPENIGGGDNISNLPYGQIDSIITSPPYEGSLESSSKHTKEGMPERDKKLGQTGTYETLDDEAKGKISSGFQSEKALKKLKGNPRGYSNSGDNIGNLKSTSYLEAMALVYSQCYRVLKPQDLMVLAIKNFIRSKKEIDLRGDTIRLCGCIGFQFLEEHHRVLPGQSFWRTIYRRRHPDAPVIDREYILVFRR